MSVDSASLAPVARLLGRLLVRELDAETLAEWRDPGVAAGLASIGIELPEESRLVDLEAEWFAAFLHPARHLPPVQSLWESGQYDGDAKLAVEGIARAAGLELSDGARGAPPDQLGCLLLLWADLSERDPALAGLLCRAHISWVPRALEPVARDGGFYAAVASAAIELVGLLGDDRTR